MNDRVNIILTPDEYGDGTKTHSVTVHLDGIPISDADGPTLEYALLQLVENLAIQISLLEKKP